MASEESQDQWDSLAETLGTPRQPQADEQAKAQPSNQPAPRAAEKPRPSRPRRQPPSMFEPEAVEPAPAPAESAPAEPSPTETVARSATPSTDPEPEQRESRRDAEVSEEHQETDRTRRERPRRGRGKDSREPSHSRAVEGTEQNDDLTPRVSETGSAASKQLPATPIEAEPADAVPAAEGFFAAGLTLPDWFPFARKSPKPAEPVAEKPNEPASAVDEPVKHDPSEESSMTGDSSLEPHPDWMAKRAPRRAEPTVGDDEVTTDSNEESREEEDKTQRRRRPRRRGRGRGRGEKTGEAKERVEKQDSPADEDDSLATDDNIDDDMDDAVGYDSDDDGDDDIDSDDEVSTTGKAAREEKRAASHKNIPSWNDAISGVVDSNIAKRGERQRTSGPRGDGRTRGGRPRGGRGRRKSS